MTWDVLQGLSLGLPWTVDWGKSVLGFPGPRGSHGKWSTR